MKRNRILASVILFISFTVCGFSQSNLVYADWDIADGEGADTNMSSANCGNYLHGHVGLCSGGADGGGASWHVYSTSTNPKSVLGFHRNIMGSDKRGNISSTCPSSQYEWYVVYGWDGRYKSDANLVSYSGNYSYLQYGPITYNSGLPYNSYGAYSYDSGSNSLTRLFEETGNIADGTKITDYAASQLYESFTKAKTGTAKQLADQNPGYFCIRKQDIAEPTYYAQSNVRIGEGSNYNGTPIVTNDSVHEVSVSEGTETGKSLTVVFSHNIYSSMSVTNVPWQLRREVYINGASPSEPGMYIYNGDSYRLSSVLEGQWNSKTNITTAYTGDVNAKFIANNRTNGYLTRDTYKVTFLKAGTYSFCEKIFVNEFSSAYTNVCANITVTGNDVGDPGGDPGPGTEEPEDYCDVWKQYTDYDSSTSTRAYTDVISGVKVENNDTWTNYTDYTLSNGDFGVWSSGSLQYGPRSSFAVGRVYAKPGDIITWHHCYYPGVQKTDDEVVTYSHNKFNEWSSPGTYPNTNKTMGTSKLNNGFGIAIYSTDKQKGFVGTNNRKSTSDNKFSIGDTEIRAWEDTYTVPSGSESRAGLTLQEGISSVAPNYVDISSGDTHSMQCGKHKVTDYCETEDGGSAPCGYHYEYSGTCTHGSASPFIDFSTNDPRTDPVHSRDVAAVKVPYNFELSADANISKEIVYAGEDVSISTNVTANPIQNDTTMGYYATKVDQAEVRLYTYVSGDGYGSDQIVSGYNSNICGNLPYLYGDCALAETSGSGRNDKLNANETSSPEDKVGGTYNVYDAPAGLWYCAVVAAYPYTVGSETDTKDVNGNTPWKNSNSYSWYVSTPSCRQIAKKPNLQVWGNSLYSSGGIETSNSVKRMLAGFDSLGYSPSSNGNATVFGSWVELGIVANGAIERNNDKGIASGASTGLYNFASDRTPTPYVGGSREGESVSICKRSPLTIPNDLCSGQGEVLGGLGANEDSGDKLALISSFMNESQNYVYTPISGNYSIGSIELPAGQTQVIHATGSVTITGDIKYSRDEYRTAVEIPKIIIYAEENINIDCGVKRIDAVLIAGKDNSRDGIVYTCYDSSGEDSVESANQLKIFGTVISNKLVPRRTYGAAAGKYVNSEQSGQAGGATGQTFDYGIPDGSAASVVPAEIIDYDTSLYLWGAPRADASASGKLDITYQTELAPRY